MSSPCIIAVDGPAGSGKSSVAKAVARERGFGYLDSGAQYRLLGLAAVSANVDLGDERAVLSVLAEAIPEFPLDPDQQRFFLNGRDVSDEIRTPEAALGASKIAKLLGVRAELNRLFRVKLAASDYPFTVVEGRDITTVVAPDAPVRVLLTANEQVRAQRRGLELANVDTKAVASDLRARDASDSTVVDFQTAADGVTVIDSSDLSFIETVDALNRVVSEALDASAQKFIVEQEMDEQ